MGLPGTLCLTHACTASERASSIGASNIRRKSLNSTSMLP